MIGKTKSIGVLAESIESSQAAAQVMQITIAASGDNDDDVMVGGSDVSFAAGNGFRLAAGEKTPTWRDLPGQVYVVAQSGTQEISVLMAEPRG